MHISTCCSRLATQNLIQNSIIWALAHKVHNPNMKEGSIAWRADQENTVSMLMFHIWEQVFGRHLLGVNYLQFIMHISTCCSRLATQNLIQNSIIWALAHKVHNPNMKEGSIAWRADQENTVSMLMFHIWEQVFGRHLLGVNYLQFDWSGWIVLI